MTRISFPIIAVISSIVIWALSGCDDGITTNSPEIGNQPQTFSIAIGNGATGIINGTDAHGFAHNGNAVVTLEWDEPEIRGNSVVAVYTYRDYPMIDGAVNGDEAVWDIASWSVIPLESQYGECGVSEVRIKAVYTYYHPARIWFLLQWQDPVDYPSANPPYNSGYFAKRWLNDGGNEEGGFRDNRQYDLNEDWVAIMWSTWDKHYEGWDSNTYTFAETTYGFQEEGCTVTCHDTDPYNPHHTNKESEHVDLWFWSGTRTNYTDSKLDWGNGSDDPGALLDTYLDDNGMEWGIWDAVWNDEDDRMIMNLQLDEGVSSITANGTDVKPTYMSPDDPGSDYPYLWHSTDLPHFDRFLNWQEGDTIPGYVSRYSLGSTGDVSARGSYDTQTGTWTLELSKEIKTYDMTDNEEDVLLGLNYNGF